MSIDTALRERVFQPLVDRFHLDPTRSSAAAQRFHVIAMTTASITAGAVLFPLDPSFGSRLALISLLALPFYSLTYQVHRRLRRQPCANMDWEAVLQRLLMAFVGLFTCVAMLSVVMAPGAGMLLRIAALSWGLATPAAAVAMYLQVCRKPPPKKPVLGTVTVPG